MTEFYKYQGTGNDFIMIDNRNLQFDDSQVHIAQLCHRRFGIGADGLILIENEEGFDFKMRYYNADGAEGSMCGNGGRCAVQFASDLGIFANTTHFIAIDGPHQSIIENGLVSLEMIDVNSVHQESEGYFLNTGSPHLVIMVEELKNYDVKTKGAAIRYSPYWKQKGGVNVNFVQYLDSTNIKVRTYERGVEDETYSCGTGVTACAIVSQIQKNTSSRVNIETLGGNLKVEFQKNGDLFEKIKLIGPATFVYKGSI